MGELYTLWEILSGHVLVLADEHAQLVITWNESKTFIVYQVHPGGFEEVTSFTSEAISATASGVAQAWLEDAQENHDF
jgi:hypothetical protein